MNKDDLLKILQDDIKHIDNVDPLDENQSEKNVIIYPKNVKHMLLAYLTDEINAQDLNKWATFICMRMDYSSPGDPLNDKLSDYYEDMRYVIQCLSTPEIDGAITKERVKQYLAELLKYSD